MVIQAVHEELLPGFINYGKIGKGGGGDIYKCLQVSLNRMVAIKKVSIKEKTKIEALKHEAKILAKLSNMEVLTIISVQNTSDSAHLILEYIDGETLHEKFRHSKRISRNYSLNIFIKTLRAFKNIHQKNVIHQDVKPQNIMISNDNAIRLVDFGSAHDLKTPNNNGNKSIVIGTPNYMSPEQVLGEKLDNRSDIYSLGATFYYMLYGKPPFEGKSNKEIMKQHLTSSPYFNLEKEIIDINITAIIAKMMSKSPSNRYQSVHQITDDLDRAINRKHLTPRRKAPISTNTRSRRRSISKRLSRIGK